ncbi:hypothetical protein HK405_011915, partial [Cladochytrium tenue]
SAAATTSTTSSNTTTSWVVRRGSKLVEVSADGSSEADFAFASFNVPNLHYLEDRANVSTGERSAPTEFEQADALAAVARLGGRVVRVYALSVQSTSGLSAPQFHVANNLASAGGGGNWTAVAGTASPVLYLNEGLLADGLDRAVALAAERGLRLVVPLIDRWSWWGGIAAFAELHGLGSTDQFYTDAGCVSNFLAVARTLANRTNTATGRRYCEEPAVLGWETGNELETTTRGRVPANWTLAVAEAIREVLATVPASALPASVTPGFQQLVIDGSFGTVTGWEDAVLQSDNVDMITGHYYQYGPDNVPRYVALVVVPLVLAICAVVGAAVLVYRARRVATAATTAGAHELADRDAGRLSFERPTSLDRLTVTGQESPPSPKAAGGRARGKLAEALFPGQRGSAAARQRALRVRAVILGVIAAGLLGWLAASAVQLYRALTVPYSAMLARDLAVATAAGKPFLVGEYGLASTSQLEGLLSAAVDAAPACVGSLLWSLRFRARDGGFYTHSEGNGYWSYHYPGFAGNDGEGFGADEQAAVALVARYAAKVAPAAVPAAAVPSPAPVVLAANATATAAAVTTVGLSSSSSSSRAASTAAPVLVTWRGSAGATRYLVERTTTDPETNNNATWTTVTATASDAAAYASGGRTLVADYGAADAAAAWYRVTAFNNAGQSNASEP